jgi:hypothetical protein
MTSQEDNDLTKTLEKQPKKKGIGLLIITILLLSAGLLVFVFGLFIPIDWIYMHLITGLGIFLPAILVSIYLIYLRKQLRTIGKVDGLQIGFFFSSLVSIGMLIAGIIFVVNDDFWYIILTVFCIFGFSGILSIVFGVLYFRKRITSKSF